MDPDNWAIIIMKNLGGEAGIENVFHAVLRLFVAAEVQRDFDEALEEEPSMPGYLSRSFDGVKVYVPLNLSYVSPGKRDYESILGAVKDFRYQANAEVCLSGSATFLGRTKAVKDVDLAEYFYSPRTDAVPLFDLYIDRPRSSGSELVATQAKETAKKHWSSKVHPFTNTRSGLAKHPWRVLNIKARSRLFGSDKFEVTNKIFPAAPGELQPHTYVYQEIVICVDGAKYDPPRSLAEPWHLLKYVHFLLEASLEHFEESTEKALKRVISLTLLLGLRRDFDFGIELLPKGDTESFDVFGAQRFIHSVRNKVLELYEDAMEALNLQEITL